MSYDISFWKVYEIQHVKNVQDTLDEEHDENPDSTRKQNLL